MSVRDAKADAAESHAIKARFSINVVENERGEILLLKRSPAARLGPGRWGFPAGHIEPGESPAACARRELFEELGQDCRVTLRREFGPLRDSGYGRVYELYLFHVVWHGGSVTLNNEHTDFAWVDRCAYRGYDVMDGIDEDLYFLDVWPRQYLNTDRLDAALARRRAAGETWA